MQKRKTGSISRPPDIREKEKGWGLVTTERMRNEPKHSPYQQFSERTHQFSVLVFFSVSELLRGKKEETKKCQYAGCYYW